MLRNVTTGPILTAAAAILVALAAGCRRAPDPAGPVLLDVAGDSVRPLSEPAARAVVFLFARTDCPISNRYAPEVRRIHEKFAGRGVQFWMVYPDPDESAEAIQEHLREYGYRMEALRDTHHALVALTGARVTPEAALFVPGPAGARMVYRGRIDDRYVDFGLTRPAATVHDLEGALGAVLEGRPVPVRETTAVGCFIPELR